MEATMRSSSSIFGKKIFQKNEFFVDFEKKNRSKQMEQNALGLKSL
jgi:hypothetical protein